MGTFKRVFWFGSRFIISGELPKSFCSGSGKSMFATSHSRTRRIENAVGPAILNHRNFRSSAALASARSSSVEVYTDAASEVAAAGFWPSTGKWFVYRWNSSTIKADPGIAWMELFAIVLASRIWGSHWCNRDVYIKTDSQCSVTAWHNHHFHSENMEALRKKLQQTKDQHGFGRLTISYIHGNDNLADTISREKLKAFWQKNPGAELTPVQIPARLIQDLLP